VAAPRVSVEAFAASAYFVLYTGYLFLHPEGELWHWITLVLVPLVGLFVLGRYASLDSLLRSIGLARGNAASGLGWVVILGLGFQILQLMNRRQRAELQTILGEPLAILALLGAFVLLIGTVATTEEVFFRGVLQTRLADFTRREWAGALLATAAFIAYHVPYAYLKPSWPSAGDFPRALQLAAVNGGVGGIALGFVYWRSRRNLIAVVLLHACIDLIPATRLVHRLVSGRP
jgi:membrane protease YdiL (CAAX protease family)